MSSHTHRWKQLLCQAEKFAAAQVELLQQYYPDVEGGYWLVEDTS